MDLIIWTTSSYFCRLMGQTLKFTPATLLEFAKGKTLLMKCFCKRTLRDSITFTRTNCTMCFLGLTCLNFNK